MLVSHTQLLLQLNDVALEKTNDCCTSHSLQPVTCFPDGLPQLRIPGVCFQALPRCVHRISRSLELSLCLGVSTPTSFWPPSMCRGFDSHSCFIFWRCRFFRVFFVLFPLSLCMESTSYVLSFRMVFVYLVTTGWILDISLLCENSIEFHSNS